MYRDELPVKDRSNTYAAKVVEPQNQVTRIRKGIHDEKAVGKHAPNVREV
jgi:hypothetical protein